MGSMLEQYWARHKEGGGESLATFVVVYIAVTFVVFVSVSGQGRPYPADASGLRCSRLFLAPQILSALLYGVDAAPLLQRFNKQHWHSADASVLLIAFACTKLLIPVKLPLAAAITLFLQRRKCRRRQGPSTSAAAEHGALLSDEYGDHDFDELGDDDDDGGDDLEASQTPAPATLAPAQSAAAALRPPPSAPPAGESAAPAPAKPGAGDDDADDFEDIVMAEYPGYPLVAPAPGENPRPQPPSLTEL